MKIRSLALTSFMSHKQTRLDFPERGVILITGENGAGKSSIAEGIAVGLWGSTLRGVDPWNGKGGAVSVETGAGLLVVRSQRKGRAGVAFGEASADPETWTTYDTPTKAQEALDAVVGSFEVWRRSHVFSSADAALFSASTDGERKRFIERILGVERFDPALEACREQLRRADQKLAEIGNRVAVLNEKIAGADRRLVDAMTAVQTDVPNLTEDAPERARALSTKLAAARARAGAVTSALTGSGAEKAAAQAELRQREAEAARLASGTCPTCAQVIPSTLKAALADAVRVAELHAREAEAANAVKVADLREQLDEAREADTSLSEKLGRLQQLIAASNATRQQRENTARVIASATADLEEARAARAVQASALAEATAEAAVLRATERVLGLKGVRANILGNALAGLEGAVNVWLARLASRELRVNLGATAGTAALDVVGAGGGHGYKGASGGERRRIDVALLLGLGEFAAASAGSTGGLLILDEVLDALDKDGLERACRAIEELAEDRVVIVVSHLDEMTATLRPAARWTVDGGTVTVSGDARSERW